MRFVELRVRWSFFERIKFCVTEIDLSIDRSHDTGCRRSDLVSVRRNRENADFRSDPVRSGVSDNHALVFLISDCIQNSGVVFANMRRSIRDAIFSRKVECKVAVDHFPNPQRGAKLPRETTGPDLPKTDRVLPITF